MSIIYGNIIRFSDKIYSSRIRPIWEHPIGPKTIFFWAPITKWFLVMAGVSDFAHTPEYISLQQSSALAISGLIWSRYAMVIRPKNWNLFVVNGFVALTGLAHILRAYRYNIKKYSSTKPLSV